jgi:membrane-associated protease RseP (regulator of RpoE activity)
MSVLYAVLFGVGILISVCLHEAGHMGTAKAFGMKVTKYFAGFGPTIWSFRRGETEYGLKAIPAGGFVKIVGMTPLDDDVEPEDEPRAFWRKPLWQRTVVLSAGSVTHFILGVVLLYICAVFVGLPNPAFASYDAAKQPAVIGQPSKCVKVKYDPKDDLGKNCTASDPVSPAVAAGLKAGDRITAFGGTATPTFGDLVTKIRASKGENDLTYVRGGETKTVKVTLIESQRRVGGTPGKPKLETAPLLGVIPKPSGIEPTVTYGPGDAVGQTWSYTGTIFTGTFAAIKNFPQKVPKLITALNGGERDPETPISVYGASVLGGEAADAGLWEFTILMLASLNVFIGVFNLFPLLPLDGGHIAIAWYERARGWIAAKRGRPDPGRVDYTRLMPVTYAVILVFGSISLLTIAADIVNPISIFGK